ncbi:MAG: hypothetical protein NC331_13615 [Lachnospiraceae bacterium]|nr:hypothetical protein [Lachnospiraceae bacterium]MCM1240403.1 hypothetical protein [Lachnospiraceae bacterium]
MDKARVYVDLNEMVTDNIVLLSKDDTQIDDRGSIVTFYEGMPVSLYSDDMSDSGEIDNLIFEGTAIKYDLNNYPNWRHVKWCAYIDWDSFMHESDMRFLRLLPIEIEKHPNDLLALQKILEFFKRHGMNKDSMLRNLEKIRKQNNFKAEDILMDLMDFVVGWCSQDLSIYQTHNHN